MKTTKKLNQLEKEFDYWDYLVTVQIEPYHTGVIENIERKIKTIKKIKKLKMPDRQTMDKTSLILEKYEMLQQRYYSLHPKR